LIAPFVTRKQYFSAANQNDKRNDRDHYGSETATSEKNYVMFHRKIEFVIFVKVENEK
jgi:hypothetical protein